jgi:FlaA1/EpsC-like NDP-sugar epimerase
VIAVHLALWAASLSLAFALRFDFRIPAAYLDLLAVWLPVLLVLRTGAFWQWSLFRGIWRYTGASDLWAIIKATTAGTLAMAAVLVFLFGAFPRSILIIDGSPRSCSSAG